MAEGQEHQRDRESAEHDKHAGRVGTAPPQADRGPDGPDRDRQIAQEPQQSTGLGGQS